MITILMFSMYFVMGAIAAAMALTAFFFTLTIIFLIGYGLIIGLTNLYLWIKIDILNL